MGRQGAIRLCAWRLLAGLRHDWTHFAEGARAEERPNFLRQPRLFADIVCGLNLPVRLVKDLGRHDFNVIDGLADPDAGPSSRPLRPGWAATHATVAADVADFPV
jgi:hypothetical protein